jgi:hypothetical protein
VSGPRCVQRTRHFVTCRNITKNTTLPDMKNMGLAAIFKVLFQSRYNRCFSCDLYYGTRFKTCSYFYVGITHDKQNCGCSCDLNYGTCFKTLFIFTSVTHDKHKKLADFSCDLNYGTCSKTLLFLRRQLMTNSRNLRFFS